MKAVIGALLTRDESVQVACLWGDGRWQWVQEALSPSDARYVPVLDAVGFWLDAMLGAATTAKWGKPRGTLSVTIGPGTVTSIPPAGVGVYPRPNETIRWHTTGDAS